MGYHQQSAKLPHTHNKIKYGDTRTYTCTHLQVGRYILTSIYIYIYMCVYTYVCSIIGFVFICWLDMERDRERKRESERERESVCLPQAKSLSDTCIWAPRRVNCIWDLVTKTKPLWTLVPSMFDTHFKLRQRKQHPVSEGYKHCRGYSVVCTLGKLISYKPT